MASTDDLKRKRDEQNEQEETAVTKEQLRDKYREYMDLVHCFLCRSENEWIVINWKRFFAVTGWDEDVMADFFSSSDYLRTVPSPLDDSAFEYVRKIYVVDHMSHLRPHGSVSVSNVSPNFDPLQSRLRTCFCIVISAFLPFSVDPEDKEHFEVTFTTTVSFDVGTIKRVMKDDIDAFVAIEADIRIHYKTDEGDGYLIITARGGTMDLPLDDIQVDSARASIVKNMGCLYAKNTPHDLLAPLCELLLRTIDVSPFDVSPLSGEDDTLMLGGGIVQRAIDCGIAAPLH
jgi:hypothetical protein